MKEIILFALAMPPKPDKLLHIFNANISTWGLNDAQVGFLFTMLKLSAADLERVIDAQTLVTEFNSMMAANPDITQIFEPVTFVPARPGKETAQ